MATKEQEQEILIDKILDKINAQGMNSLTSYERAILKGKVAEPTSNLIMNTDDMDKTYNLSFDYEKTDLVPKDSNFYTTYSGFLRITKLSPPREYYGVIYRDNNFNVAGFEFADDLGESLGELIDDEPPLKRDLEIFFKKIVSVLNMRG